VICGQSVLNDALVAMAGAGTTCTACRASRRCGRSHPLSGCCPALQPIRRPELLAAGGLYLFGEPGRKTDRPWAEPPGRWPD